MYLAALAIIAVLLVHAWMYIIPAPSEIDYEREYSGFVYMIMGVLYAPGARHARYFGADVLGTGSGMACGLGPTLFAACWTPFRHPVGRGLAMSAVTPISRSQCA